ncbi:hypothetical protein FJTKL_07010 [Diaporthe vaccinii]|uniref:Uncharacterized protein n=1 Tax=Diaporthe vaccinii TaxID=105482 RepID=A0ABR4EUQ7_9PEZI
MCSKPLCEYEGSGYSCDADPYADDFSDEDYCEPEFCDLSAASSLLERRGRPPFTVDWQTTVNSSVRSFRLSLQMRGYPGSGSLHGPTRSASASNNMFRMVRDNCRLTEIEIIDRTTMAEADVSAAWDTEHNPDAQYVRDFVRTLATGILPKSSTTTVAAIDGQVLNDNWNGRVLPSGIPRAGSSQRIRTPNGYLFDRIGSQGNRLPLLLCERNMNRMKGLIFNLRMLSPNNGGGGSGDNGQSSVGERPNPMDNAQFTALLEQAGLGNLGAQNEMFENLRMAIAVFRYINHPDAQPTVQRNRRELRTATTLIAQAVGPLRNAVAIQREFDSNWYREAADRTRAWVAERILEIRLHFGELDQNGELPPNAADVRDITDTLAEQIHYIQPPPDI